MKKPLFYFVLLSSIFMNAQTTIVEEKFEEEKAPLDYHYFPKSNKFIIEEGKQPKKVSFYVPPTLVINSVVSFDTSGKKEILAKNVDWMLFDFSVTENTFRGTNVSKSMFSNKTYKYFVNGKSTTTSDFKEKENAYLELYAHICYNDKYELAFTNKKSNTDVNLKDDELFLTVTDIFTSKSKMISIEKQDMNKLIGDALIKPHKGFVGFNTNIIDNEKFEIITKSISKDYKSSILYRTNYNMEGKKLDETAFTINIKDYYLIYSFNGGGFTKNIDKYNGGQNISTYSGKPSVDVFADDLSINNFYEDNTTKDVYIYGLFGTNSISLNRVNSPSGYYIFKFDKNGNKIWESINLITDKKDFNDDIDLMRLTTNLRFYNDKLYFSVGEDTKKNYVCYGFLDKNTGKIVKENKISYDISFTGKRSLKGYNNKDLGVETLVALDSNPKVADYIKSIKSSETILLNTVFSEKGIWLFETDRKGYYKITLFRD
jgi:hypothetical protein